MFNVGDKVLVVHKYDNNYHIVNKIGTIKYVAEDYFDWDEYYDDDYPYADRRDCNMYAIEFDFEFEDGHTGLGRNCKNGHGWNIPNGYIVRWDKNKRL